MLLDGLWIVDEHRFAFATYRFRQPSLHDSDKCMVRYADRSTEHPARLDDRNDYSTQLMFYYYPAASDVAQG
jgi:hypothetical protein